MEKTLNLAQRTVLYITIGLLPIFILPIFANPYDVPKLFLLALGISLVIILEAAKMLLSGKLQFSFGDFDLPILIFALAYLVSAVLVTPNKTEAFFLPGTATVILAGSLLYFLVNLVFKKEKNSLVLTLMISGVLLSTLSLLSATGILGKIPGIPEFMKPTTFSLSGGQLANVIFLGVLVPLAIGLVVSEKELVKKLFWGVSFLILVLGLGLSVNFLLPGKENNLVLPSFPVSWSIAVDTLKQSPLLGAGPGNYLSAFGQFRPLVYNASPLWSVRFPFASDFLLTLLTETGFLGIAGYLLLVTKGAKAIRDNIKSNPWIYLSLALALIFSLALPANLVFLVTLFVILALTSGTREKEIVISPAILVILPIAAALAAFWFFGGKLTIAEASFQQGLTSLTKNDVKPTYQSLSFAVTQNPYVDRYHATLAKVNLAVAQSLAQKKELKEEDKNAITTAIQAAISEGKATVALNPQRAASWSLLASIYQAIMPLAQGADTFAIQAYSQAVALDPIDPNLRITLGGIYYALGRYDDAIQSFQLATLAKPDLANAHYNLSAAYREKGDLDRAIAEMKTVISLVPKNSNDATTAQNELNELEKKSASAKTPAGQENLQGELTAPAPAQAPVINPPITLPSEATPPATP